MRIALVVIAALAACGRERASVDDASSGDDRAPKEAAPPRVECSSWGAPAYRGTAMDTPEVVQGGLQWREEHGVPSPDQTTVWFLADNGDKPIARGTAPMYSYPTFWTERGTLAVQMTREAPPLTLATGQERWWWGPFRVGDDVVWSASKITNEGGGVYRVPLAGGEVPTLWGHFATQLLVDGDDLYAVGTIGISRIDLRTNQATPMFAGAGARGLVLAGDRLYWVAGDSILAEPRHGGNVEVIASGLHAPQNVGVGAQTIYYTLAGENGAVFAMPRGGGPVTTVIRPDAYQRPFEWLHESPRGLVAARGWSGNTGLHRAEIFVVPFADQATCGPAPAPKSICTDRLPKEATRIGTTQAAPRLVSGGILWSEDGAARFLADDAVEARTVTGSERAALFAFEPKPEVCEDCEAVLGKAWRIPHDVTAFDRTQIYVASHGASIVWAVPRTGERTQREVLHYSDQSKACGDGILWLHRTERGLVVVPGRGWPTVSTTDVWFVPL